MANSKYCNPKSIQMIEKQQKKFAAVEPVCTPPISINTTRVNSSKPELDKQIDRSVPPYDAYVIKGLKNDSSDNFGEFIVLFYILSKHFIFFRFDFIKRANFYFFSQNFYISLGYIERKSSFPDFL